jgi:Fic family protein
LPGEFRRSQNWIGAGNATLETATFIPPPPAEMLQALNDFERFLHRESDLPPLLLCGLAHAQFETIHPFLDGNGRIGRLLITFLLVVHGVLHRPLLYLSTYLKRHRTEYYDRLTAIRERGDWESWIHFFLRGVAETAEEATTNAIAIVQLREEHRNRIQEANLGSTVLRLLDLMFQQPIVNAKTASDRLAVTDVTATRSLDRLEQLGIVEEITGLQRNRVYRYTPYWRLFQTQTIDQPESDQPIQLTESLQDT